MLENLDNDKELARKIAFSDPAVFQVSENVNTHATVHYVRDNPKLTSCLALRPIVWSDVFLCRSNCNIYQFAGYATKACLSTSSTILACRFLSLRRHTIALDVNFECILSQTEGLFVVFPFPGQPDHRILPTVTFPCGEIWTTVSSELWWPISKTRRRELIPLFYRFLSKCCNVHGWSLKVAWILQAWKTVSCCMNKLIYVFS